MRPSIKKIFNSWKVLMGLLTLLLALTAFTMVEEHYTSFQKIDNLKNQKATVYAIASIGRDDLELANIQYRGKSTQLTFEHDKLLTLHSYDVLGLYLLGYADDYEQDLEELKTRVAAFVLTAEKWYDKSTKELKTREKEMLNARNSVFMHIDTMVQKNHLYQTENFAIQRNLAYASFLFAFIILTMFLKRFSDVYKDINSLYVIESDGDPHVILTEEIDIISKRMGRKPQSSDNPSMIDPVTEINNYKGLIYAFANKKGMKDSTFIGVCVFEVDDLRALDQKYPKTFTQSVLKKIAFMISLYEQHTDIIGRTDYGQFTVVFARQSKEQAMRDCNLIRTSVEEAVFKVPRGESLKLTLSGGFVAKQSNNTIDEAITEGKSILAKGKDLEPNRILQTKDVM